MISSNEQNPVDPHAGTYNQIFPTAAAMLWQDRGFIARYYLLLVIASLAALILPLSSSLQYLGLAFVDRVLQLLFTYIVARKWLSSLSLKARSIGAAPTYRYFLFGVVLWALFSVPLALSGPGDSEFLVLLSAILFVAAASISIRYYFYPVPILLGRAPLGAALAVALDITKAERLLVVKLLVAPCGMFSLLVAIIMSFSPDGRDLWTSYAAEIAAGIFWLLSSYLALAATFLRLDERIWREEGLDPYRTARLSTLEFQGSSWLARQLRPMHGLGWLLVSALVWAANVMRLFTTPPSATISVKEIAIEGSIMKVELELDDPQYHFRGLQPIYFSLAGEQRAVIAQAPDAAILSENSENVMIKMPNDRSKTQVMLTFTANRAGKDLVALKDLYLWYRFAKLQRLEVEKVVPTP